MLAQLQPPAILDRPGLYVAVCELLRPRSYEACLAAAFKAAKKNGAPCYEGVNYQARVGTGKKSGCVGTVGWARTTDLLFHSKRSLVLHDVR